MGISGLLQGLKSTTTARANICEYADHSIAVDASSWLHKSIYSIADHYVETTAHGTVDARCIAVSSKYVLQRCQELLSYARVRRIYLVMDGERCPLKAVTNQERERRRLQNLQQARAHRAAGNAAAAEKNYQACLKVRPDLAQAVADAVTKRHGHGNQAQVQVVWAPYEADAQLVKLCVDGLAQAIVTEDSDVLVYAATCQLAVPVLYKLDRHSGSCDVLSMAWLLDDSSGTTERKDQSYSQLLREKKKKPTKTAGLQTFLQAFAARQSRKPGLGVRLFVQSCVLAGCDYAPNQLEGVGTITAFKHVRNALHRKSDQRFACILQTFPSYKVGTTEDYELLLRQSEAVFYYHPVREFATGRIVFLNDPNDGLAEKPLLESFGNDLSSFLGSLQEPSGKPQAVSASFKKETSALVPAKKPDDSKRPAFVPTRNENRAIANVMAIVNPYKKTGKRAREDNDLPQEQNRNPLQPKSPNARSKKRQNPFAMFGLPGKENPRPVKKAAPTLEAFRAQQDVRFVKRVFPKDGSHSTIVPEIMLKPAPTGKHKPNVREVIDVDQETVMTAPDSEVIDVDQETVMTTPDTKTPVEADTKSRYFSQKPDYVRRVTLESSPWDPLDTLEEPSQQHQDQPTNKPSWNQHAVPPSVKFDMYDDFLSPTKDDDALADDDIVDSSPDSAVAVIAPSRLQPPRPNSSIGPAKTMRQRFGLARKSPLERGFQRQREQYASSSRASNLRKVRSKTSTQTTLLSHFCMSRK